MLKEKCKDLSLIKYWVLDVDGTLTDGSVYYDDADNEIKKFSVKDGIIFDILQNCNMVAIVLTGRKCHATEYRMSELHVQHIFQGVKSKYDFLKEFMESNKIHKEEVGYIGDDLNDLHAMSLAGFIGCPADACSEAKMRADYISKLRGGYGAVRDVIEFVLKERGEWENIISKMYEDGQ